MWKRKAIVLPFGVREMDEHLPGGGLSYGALREIAGGGAGTVDGAAAALFAAGIAARSKGKVLWCLTRPDLFFPAIAQAGLHPDRVIFCEGDKEEDVLASMEEGLSFGGLAVVVGELFDCRWWHPGDCSWLPKRQGPWGSLSADGGGRPRRRTLAIQRPRRHDGGLACSRRRHCLSRASGGHDGWRN